MLVSHRKKFIFIKTAKTAGTSVESYFERFCMNEAQWSQSHFRDEVNGAEGIVGYRGLDSSKSKFKNHMSAMQIKNAVNSDVWEQYFKFSIIRNPFDLLVSSYFFNRNFILKKSTHSMTRNDVVTDFRHFVLQSKASLCTQLSVEKNMCTDFLIKYENILEDIESVCIKLDIPFEPEKLPQFKSEFRDMSYTFKELYDDITISYVKKKHKSDLQLGKYSFPE